MSQFNTKPALLSDSGSLKFNGLSKTKEKKPQNQPKRQKSPQAEDPDVSLVSMTIEKDLDTVEVISPPKYNPASFSQNLSAKHMRGPLASYESKGVQLFLNGGVQKGLRKPVNTSFNDRNFQESAKGSYENTDLSIEFYGRSRMKKMMEDNGGNRVNTSESHDSGIGPMVGGYSRVALTEPDEGFELGRPGLHRFPEMQQYHSVKGSLASPKYVGNSFLTQDSSNKKPGTKHSFETGNTFLGTTGLRKPGVGVMPLSHYDIKGSSQNPEAQHSPNPYLIIKGAGENKPLKSFKITKQSSTKGLHMKLSDHLKPKFGAPILTPQSGHLKEMNIHYAMSNSIGKMTGNHHKSPYLNPGPTGGIKALAVNPKKLF